MKNLDPGSPVDLTSVPRALLSITLGLLRTVERAVDGNGRRATARGNAWAAVCADRERARQRDEVRQLVAALAVAEGATGRSPGVMVSPAAGTRPTR